MRVSLMLGARRCWLVLVAAFLFSTLEGTLYSFGLLYPELVPVFGHSGALVIPWVGSTANCVFSLIGPVGGLLILRLGERSAALIGTLVACAGFLGAALAPNLWVMIATYGLCAGSGLGINCICSYVVVGRSFTRWRCVATAVTSCGSGVGTLLIAPLTAWVIERLGWRIALWTQAGLVMQALCLAMVFGSSSSEESVCSESSSSESGQSPMSVKELLVQPSFMMMAASAFVCLLGFYIPYTYLPTLAQAGSGASVEASALLLCIIGAGSLVGRLVLGVVCDQPWCDTHKVYALALLVGGLACLAMPLVQMSYVMLCVCAAVFGLTAAASFGLTSVLLVDILGLQNLPTTFGLLNLFRGVATLLGIPIAGLLSDRTGRYEITFYVAGAALVLSALIILPLHCVHSHEPSQLSALTVSSPSLSQPQRAPVHQVLDSQSYILFAGSHTSLVFVDRKSKPAPSRAFSGVVHKWSGSVGDLIEEESCRKTSALPKHMLAVDCGKVYVSDSCLLNTAGSAPSQMTGAVL